MSYLLAIDQSTSATKAVLFDDNGRAIDGASREHRQHYPQPGWVEHDAAEIWRDVLAVVRDVAGRRSAECRDLVGVSLTNQRETIVAFDRRTGEPLRPAIVWQCRRGDGICEQLIAAGAGRMVESKTGLKIDGYFSGSKMRWLAENEPEVRTAVTNGTAALCTIDSYLIHRLNGGEIYATDPTNASRTLLYNIDSLSWDGELCDLFCVPATALPEVRDSFSRFGETDVDGALPRRVPIVGVMGDSQASLFAQRCFQAGSGKATFGTGTSILLNVGAQRPADAGGAVVALAWVREGRPVYALEGLVNYSAATISWLKNQLGLIADAAESERLAIAVEDNGGVYLIPAFAGLSAPYWKPDARAAIVGMTAHTRREHIVRAALEAIAYQMHDALEMMQQSPGASPAVLHVDGGPTRNNFLMQFVADVCGVELHAAETPESSALGAAMAGMLGLGLRKSLGEFDAADRPTRTFTPQMSSDRRSRLIAGWRDAVRRVIM